MPGYEETIREGRRSGAFLNGFELDVDRNGDIILDEPDRRFAQVRLGAYHHMAEKYDAHIASRQFLFCTEALLKYGPCPAHRKLFLRRLGL